MLKPISSVVRIRNVHHLVCRGSLLAMALLNSRLEHLS